MDKKELTRIGDRLRQLGHERREVVQRIMSEARSGEADEAGDLYQQLDGISEQCMGLLAEQRKLVQEQLGQL